MPRDNITLFIYFILTLQFCSTLSLYLICITKKLTKKGMHSVMHQKCWFILINTVKTMDLDCCQNLSASFLKNALDTVSALICLHFLESTEVKISCVVLVLGGLGALYTQGFTTDLAVIH